MLFALGVGEKGGEQRKTERTTKKNDKAKQFGIRVFGKRVFSEVAFYRDLQRDSRDMRPFTEKTLIMIPIPFLNDKARQSKK